MDGFNSNPIRYQNHQRHTLTHNSKFNDGPRDRSKLKEAFQLKLQRDRWKGSGYGGKFSGGAKSDRKQKDLAIDKGLEVVREID